MTHEFNKVDWSDEITELDNQLTRIGWTREEEKLILEELGYSNRNRITDFKDLILFIYILKQIKTNEKVDIIKSLLSKENLIHCSDNKIKKLKWDIQGVIRKTQHMRVYVIKILIMQRFY